MAKPALKNPFGMRDGRIIMVDDLSEAERGLKCRCACPSCKAPFVAKLGQKNVHHFAHSSDACDETIAYLEGLYQLLKEYLLGGPTDLPEVGVFYQIPNAKEILVNEDNWEEYVSFKPIGTQHRDYLLFKNRQISFESVEIIYQGKEPVAVIAEYKEKHLAFIITPPDTVCKTKPDVKRYKEYATIEISLRDAYEKIAASTRQDIFDLFDERMQWIYSPFVGKCFKDINKKIQDQWAKEEKRNSNSNKKQSEDTAFPLMWAPEPTLTCIFCRKTKPVSAFWEYGGSNLPKGMGKCKKCYEQGLYR